MNEQPEASAAPEPAAPQSALETEFDGALVEAIKLMRASKEFDAPVLAVVVARLKMLGLNLPNRGNLRIWKEAKAAQESAERHAS